MAPARARSPDSARRSAARNCAAQSSHQCGKRDAPNPYAMRGLGAFLSFSAAKCIRVCAIAALSIVLLGANNAGAAPAFPSAYAYVDGHSRPRALLYNAADGLLYVALSTADEVAVVDPAAQPPRVLSRVA